MAASVGENEPLHEAGNDTREQTGATSKQHSANLTAETSLSRSERSTKAK